MGEMHFRLRTEGNSPVRQAAAVALGTFIGVFPVYGLHLLLCVGVARLFALSRVTTYLAAHINNPFTAPGLIYVSFGVGNWLRSGTWPVFDKALVETITVWSIGRDLLVGSAVAGAFLALIFGTVSLAISLKWQTETPVKRLWESVSHRYLPAGILHWEFVLGKLKRDPVYKTLLRSGLLPDRGDLVDLGCGRAIVPAMIVGAVRSHAAGAWPASWPAPPRELTLTGVEVRESVADVARTALAGLATIETASLADYTPPAADALLLLDVLHYLDTATQERVLERACAALRPGGVLLLREADADAGLRFFFTRAGERINSILRGEPRRRFAYRSLASWRGALERCGLAVETLPTSQGTPFGNGLLVGRRAPAGE